MRGMTRVPTGGLKGIQHEKIDSSRKKAHGTRRLLVDVLSDAITGSIDGNPADAMATAMLETTIRGHTTLDDHTAMLETARMVANHAVAGRETHGLSSPEALR